MSTLFLRTDDFVVQKGPRGNILCNEIPGYSLILFYSTYCTSCQTIIPVFKKLPGTIEGCQFGMLNVSTNKGCIEKSNKTITPIKYVPYIVLYIDGQPYMSYKGPEKVEEIRRFILDIHKSFQKKQTFTSERKTVEQGSSNSANTSAPTTVPAFLKGIGVPVFGNAKEGCYLGCDGNVCYLTEGGLIKLAGGKGK
jgi:thiol-disulfide isomerase/thioredoxin